MCAAVCLSVSHQQLSYQKIDLYELGVDTLSLANSTRTCAGLVEIHNYNIKMAVILFPLIKPINCNYNQGYDSYTV